MSSLGVIAGDESQEDSFWPRSAFFADFGYLTEGLTNNGTGLGVGYEQMVAEHFSFRVKQGVVERALGTDDVTHIITSFLAGWHPLSKGLQGLNVQLGLGFSNTQITKSKVPSYQRLFPFIETYVGYQFLFWKRLLVEPYVNLMFVTKNPDLDTTGIHSIVNIDGINIGVVF